MTCATLWASAVPRVSGRQLLLAVFAAGLVVEIWLAGPYLLDAFDALEDVRIGWLLVAVVAEVVSMNAFARLQRRMLASGGTRVSLPRMVALTYEANSMSVTLPAGSVLSTLFVLRRLRLWGATVTTAGFTVLSTGVLSTVAFAGLAVIAAVLTDSGGWTSAALLVLTALTVLWVAYRGRHGGLGGPVRRVAVGGLHLVNRVRRRAAATGVEVLESYLRDLTAVRPRRRDWLLGGGSAVSNWVADLVCLVAAAHAVGAGDVAVSLLLLAWIAGLSSSNLTLLPGGLGVVDAAMILTLTGGGVRLETATAAVVLYRLVSFAFVAAVGWVTWSADAVVGRRRGRLVPGGDVLVVPGGDVLVVAVDTAGVPPAAPALVAAAS